MSDTKMTDLWEWLKILLKRYVGVILTETNYLEFFDLLIFKRQRSRFFKFGYIFTK